MEQDITVEKLINGGLLLSTIINQHFIKKIYFYHTKKEAIKRFKEHLKERNY